jgi:hypothetical protein
VTIEDLDEASAFPRDGVIACEVVGEKFTSADGDLVCVDTSNPHGISTEGGVSQFFVGKNQLVDDATAA